MRNDMNEEDKLIDHLTNELNYEDYKIFVEFMRIKDLQQKVLKDKLLKLKRLLLLTDPVVEKEIMSELQLIQWNEFIKKFPDEDQSKGY